MRFAVAILGLLVGAQAFGFSAGAPICEVNTLPLVEMSPTLADPPPAGWRINGPSVYSINRPVRLRITHPNAKQQVRGVLLFAKRGPFTGAGRFEWLSPASYQYIPAPALCGEWALSHTNALPKSQSDLVFDWQSAGEGTVIIRAFLIEECGESSGGCRGHQALTPVLVLQEALFTTGFE